MTGQAAEEKGLRGVPRQAAGRAERLCTVPVRGGGRWPCSEWPLEGRMGAMAVSDEVCLGAVLTARLLRCNESICDETPGEGVNDSGVRLGESVCSHIRGVRRKPLHAFAVVRVPTAGENPMPKRYSLGWQILPPANIGFTRIEPEKKV